jgi:hypothetical protein
VTRPFIPEHLDDLTPDWLTSALCERGVLSDAAVVSVEREILGDGEGFLGVIARLSLAYDRVEPGAPAAIGAKLPLAANRAMGEMMGAYERENLFYEELGEEIPLRTPRLYYSALDRDRGSEKQAEILAFFDRLPVSWSRRSMGFGRWVAGRKQRRYVLLMEDLRDVRSGDQVRGGTPDDCRRLLEAVAPAHAKFWGGGRLEGRFWLLPQGIDVRMRFGMYRDHRERFTARFRADIDTELEGVLSWLDVHGLDLSRRLFETAPCTLVHSDLRLDNVFFDDRAGAADSVIVFDWQLVRRGPAAYDIAYFLAGALDPETPDEVEAGLLADYHRALIAGGVTDYDLAAFDADYRRALLVCLLTLSTTDDVDMGDDRGVELIETWIRRLFGRVRGTDLGALL